MDNKQLNKELAKNMNNPYYFNPMFAAQYKITLDSDNINQVNSKITISSQYNLEIEPNQVNSIMKQMATIYARLINQYIFKYRTVFLAKFDKQDEDNQILDEIRY